MVLLCPAPPSAFPRAAPDAFAALMDLYECNYIHMRRLLPVVPPPQARRVSRIAEGLDLHLLVLERCRYTSELTLTYRFAQPADAVLFEPNLRIRIYHDARQAEALAGRSRRQAPWAAGLSACGDGVSPLLSGWRRNRFLYKWLRYCLRQGHRFPVSSRAQV